MLGIGASAFGVHLASVYLFFRASLCFCESLLDSYADIHIFLVESSGKSIGTSETGDVDVGLTHGEIVLVWKNWEVDILLE